ncbi:sortase domain-containing protein [Frondihabitans cladoniiphilus]|uniref:Sortase family protein n=1 Tax=Frondihabitans cladoniiphilus TaxID=715785 RepID=A0ABP8VRC4_9MICO
MTGIRRFARPRIPRSVVVCFVAGLAVVGLAACSTSGSGSGSAGSGSTSLGSTGSTSSATASAGAGAAGSVQDPDTQSLSDAPAAGVVPTRIAIPAIGIDASMQDLAIGAQGELDPPTNATDAGWYAKGVVPGAVGPAIIAGHIDSTTGPGVFLHLNKLVAGDQVTVTMSSGSVETWRVASSLQSAKSNFPTSDVYGTTPTPQLRLITCQGTFDPKIGHYDDNLIVFADLVSSTPPTS